MSSYVVDTSIVVKWLNTERENDIELANRLLEDALNGKIELVAPELVKYEVANVLLFSKKLSPNEADIVLAQFYTLPIHFAPDFEELSVDSFDLAHSLGITYYDAAFLAVAKYYDAILITENIKHQGKATDIEVISLKDY